jgi:hypothetical protein
VKDHGIFRDGSKEIPEAQHPLYRRTLLQDLNRQGAVVLEGKTLGNFYPFLFYVFLPETVLSRLKKVYGKMVDLL